MSKTTAIAISLAGAVLTTSVALPVSDYINTQNEVHRLELRAETYQSKTEILVASLTEEKTKEETLVTEIARKQGIVEARDEAIKTIGEFSASVGKAKDKVSFEEERNTVLAAQNVIFEATEAKQVVDATVTIKQATETLENKISEWEAEQERKRQAEEAANRTRNSGSTGGVSNDGSSGGGGNWFAEMRTILNNVGGGHIQLAEYDGNCLDTWAVACAWSDGRITVNSSIASWSYGRKVWAMTHELAHQYQFGKWGSIQSSGTYQSLFNGDIELLANCMTAVRGVSWGGSCSQAQLDYARTIW